MQGARAPAVCGVSLAQGDCRGRAGRLGTRHNNIAMLADVPVRPSAASICLEKNARFLRGMVIIDESRLAVPWRIGRDCAQGIVGLHWSTNGAYNGITTIDHTKPMP